MEQHSHEPTDDQRETLSTDGGAAPDTDVRVEIMSRGKRQEALAWVQAYKLIRGGVDEVVEFIEGSQYTIELLLQTLRDAACRRCDQAPESDRERCEFCRRREELLDQLA
jgi:hypothetical protein